MFAPPGDDILCIFKSLFGLVEGKYGGCTAGLLPGYNDGLEYIELKTI